LREISNFGGIFRGGGGISKRAHGIAFGSGSGDFNL